MNTGEGGLSKYHEEGGADIVFQIGTGKIGVRDPNAACRRRSCNALLEKDIVKMFEIKLSQGAKPGKGGMLPGEKVTEEIAEIRGLEIGESAISPNRHVELNSNNDLLEMIVRVRKVTQKPVGFKAVISDPSCWMSCFY